MIFNIVDVSTHPTTLLCSGLHRSPPSRVLETRKRKKTNHMVVTR